MLKNVSRLPQFFFFFCCLSLIGVFPGFKIVDVRADEEQIVAAQDEQSPERADYHIAQAAETEKTTTSAQGEQPPMLHPESPNYRTPRAGEAFRMNLFGREITASARDRRSTSALDLGFAFYKPLPENRQFIPFGALYFWRHPDDQKLTRAEVAVLYNDLFLARRSPGLDPLEWVFTFNNYTLPFKQREIVDGKAIKNEELFWGYVRPGLGLGYRKQVSPGHQDNMAAIDLTVEPGFLFFKRASGTADNFITPKNNFELRGHLQMRWDAFERNILSLPHEGFAAGADLVYGYRSDWKDWGLDGSQPADGGRDYLSFMGYFVAATGIPGIDSDRHRLIGSLHGGVGYHLDRFSAPRVGGGNQSFGEEYGSSWRPVFPGSVIQEFFPKHYAVAAGEYRWELLPFTYLSLDGAVGWLDRLRLSETGTFFTKNDILPAVGAKVRTGFFFNSRLILAYNYNFSVIRQDKHGGHEIFMLFSRPL